MITHASQPQSIKQHLTKLVVRAVATFGLVILIALMFVAYKAIQKMTIDEGIATTDYISRVPDVSLAILFGERSRIATLLQPLMTIPSLLYAAAYNRDKQLLASVGVDQSHADVLHETPTLDEGWMSKDGRITFSKSVWLQSENKDVATKPEHVGYVTIAFDSARISKPLAHMAIYATGLMSLLVVIWLWFVVRYAERIARPITDLSDLMDEKRNINDSTPYGPVEVRQMWKRFIEFKQQQDAHQRDLESRVEERTRELTIARDAAVSAAKSKTDLAARVSHELRTPLQAIVGYSEFLRDTVRRGDIQQAIEELAKIEVASAHLQELVTDVLNFTRADSGRGSTTPVRTDVDKLVKDVVLSTEAAVHKRKNKLVVQTNLSSKTIWIDATKLRQILINLISNSAKYSENEAINLDVAEAASPEGNRIRFTVTDRGEGMPPDLMLSLFTPYRTGDRATTLRYGGSGLGLTICKDFAELLGGHITIESTPRVGTTVLVDLPLVPIDADELADHIPDQAAHQSLKQRILIAEDSVVVRDILRRSLERDGHELIEVGTGKAALDLMSQRDFDGLLCDIEMPEATGLEVLHALRHGSVRTPGWVALLTATPESSIPANLRAQATAVLHKPVSPDALRDFVSRHRNLQSSSRHEFTATSPLDINVLRALANSLHLRDGGVSILEKALQLVKDEVPRIVTDARAGDIDSARSHIHRLRGGVAYIGGRAIEAWCATVAQNEYQGLRTDAGKHLDQLDGIVTHFVSAVHDEIDLASAESTPEKT